MNVRCLAGSWVNIEDVGVGLLVNQQAVNATSSEIDSQCRSRISTCCFLLDAGVVQSQMQMQSGSEEKERREVTQRGKWRSYQNEMDPFPF